MATALIKFDEAKRALAVATSIDEVREIRNQAEALRAYHRQSRDSLHMQNQCAEIKIRAERRGGEILIAMAERGERRSQSDGRPSEVLHDATLNLDDLDIERTQSHRWQAIARIPDDDFEEHIRTTKEREDELTSRGIEWLARRHRCKVVEDQPEPPPREPITKPGDLWRLGEHLLLCGDATNPQHRDLLPTTVGTILLTDIPYNIADMTEATTVTMPMGGTYTSRLGDWDSSFDVTWFLDTFTKPTIEAAGSVYVFCAGEQVGCLLLPLKRMKRICSGQIIWHKTNPTPSIRQVGWRWAHENIAFARSLDAPWHWDGQAEMRSVWSGAKQDGSPHVHPTQKPVWVMAKPIAASSNEGDVVVDPFLGSGSTLIAAEQLGRKCYGIEIEPRYCDSVIARWEKLTGKKAVRQRGREALGEN